MPSSRWRHLAVWLAAVAIALAALGFATLPGPLRNTASVLQPVRNTGRYLWNRSRRGFAAHGRVDVSVSHVACLQITLIHGEEREQLKWLAYTASFAALFIATTLTTNLLGLEGPVAESFEVLGIGAFLGIIASAGIAILRYRLYDINLIINRTLVYVPLTAIIGGSYIAGVQLFRIIFTGVTGQTSDAAVVLTTLAVAAAFTPIRNRLQAVVDRRFKEPHDPRKSSALPKRSGEAFGCSTSTVRLLGSSRSPFLPLNPSAA